MTKNKKCSVCKETLPLSSFYQRTRKDKNGVGYYLTTCISCSIPKKEERKLRSERYAHKNAQRLRAKDIQKLYNLSWNDYVALWEEQGGLCAICRDPLKLHRAEDASMEVARVDHCHTTGKVRGLLCGSCNAALGMLKDSALVCKLAAQYLEKGNR